MFQSGMEEFSPADREQIACLVACTVDTLFGGVARLAGVNGQATSQFHSLSVPKITIRDYLQWLVVHIQFSGECLILALVYVDRILRTQPQIRVNLLSIHRLLLISLLSASKFFDDETCANVEWAHFGGIGVKELNRLERDFLELVGYKLFVSPDEFTIMYQTIIQPHLHRYCGDGNKCFFKVTHYLYVPTETGVKLHSDTLEEPASRSSTIPVVSCVATERTQPGTAPVASDLSAPTSASSSTIITAPPGLLNWSSIVVGQSLFAHDLVTPVPLVSSAAKLLAPPAAPLVDLLSNLRTSEGKRLTAHITTNRMATNATTSNLTNETSTMVASRPRAALAASSSQLSSRASRLGTVAKCGSPRGSVRHNVVCDQNGVSTHNTNFHSIAMCNVTASESFKWEQKLKTASRSSRSTCHNKCPRRNDNGSENGSENARVALSSSSSSSFRPRPHNATSATTLTAAQAPENHFGNIKGQAPLDHLWRDTPKECASFATTTTSSVYGKRSVCSRNGGGQKGLSADCDPASATMLALERPQVAPRPVRSTRSTLLMLSEKNQNNHVCPKNVTANTRPGTPTCADRPVKRQRVDEQRAPYLTGANGFVVASGTLWPSDHVVPFLPNEATSALVAPT